MDRLHQSGNSRLMVSYLNGYINPRKSAEREPVAGRLEGDWSYLLIGRNWRRNYWRKNY